MEQTEHFNSNFRNPPHRYLVSYLPELNLIMVCRRGRIHWIWLKNLPSIVHKSDVLDDAIFFF